ncbi:DUF2815 family protein [Cellulosilyticum sp. WCF-2]|uniref:DUF2815 family protein n=1 Tax=Cellulosilyticum sp. WCF-2 TaxID=2497860 RepID=UPI000F8C380C|nr:DUF2815 family protein [Cellulosilyticum sp. WCF-2]QEH69329.1 DUF2815 family protein [Cellulosilyticum sp. WCF-2]
MSKVVTGKVRFSYANIWQAKSINGSEEKYSVSLIIPKSDVKTIEEIQVAMEEAKQEGIAKFGGKIPTNLKLPLRDGDIDRPDDEAYQGCYFINANSKDKPQIVDKKVKPILDPNEVYSGCYGRASINFYAFNQNGNKGIACGLGNLQKLEDGEPLSGHSRAEDDFEAYGEDDFLS